MLNIQINNPEIETFIKEAYGENTAPIAQEFARFIKQQQIKQDISVSIQQLNNGEGIPVEQAINEIRAKYE